MSTKLSVKYGRGRLLLGDCLERMSEIRTGSVDMVFADLPYGVTHNKWDTVIPFEPLWDQLLRIGKRNAAFMFTATQPFATALICSQPKLFRYDLIWEKPQGIGYMNAAYRPISSHEIIVMFSTATSNPMSKNILCYNPQKTQGKPYCAKRQKSSKNFGSGLDKSYVTENMTGERYPTSVIKIAVGEKQRYHPTQKPVVLLEWLVKTYSNPNDVILDPTMGSGTTGVACMNTGRRFVGIEQDATYFKTAAGRILA